MKTGYILICSLILILLAAQVSGEWQPRPVTGVGVLTVRNFNPDSSSGPPLLIFYQEPGVSRIGERPVSSIPLLSSLLSAPAGEYPVAVIGKKGEWLLVAYDDAGREGWVKLSRWWGYESWADFLIGRTVYLLSGLGKEINSFHGDHSSESPSFSGLAADIPLDVREEREGWLMVAIPSGKAGWIPWKNGDGSVPTAERATCRLRLNTSAPGARPAMTVCAI